VKKFWKKLTKTGKVVVGAVTLALGLGGTYWAYERVGMEVNIDRTYANQKFEDAIFIGDTGENSAVRKVVVQHIKERKPKFIFLLGDLGYPWGITGPKEFEANVRPFLIPGAETHCILGNHDSMAIAQKERDWLATNADKLGCKFGNSYKMLVFADACVLTMDSTVYYVGKEYDILGRQEEFLDKALGLSECTGKHQFLLAHHNIVGFGGHKNDVDGQHKEFILGLKRKYPKLKYVHGHEHLIANYWDDFWTFGSGSKDDECDYRPEKGFCMEVIGYGLWDGRLMNVVKVQ